jgi:hypothetical protein
MKQVKGKVKEDIGKVKEKSEQVGTQVKETSEGLWEKIQDFFGD